MLLDVLIHKQRLPIHRIYLKGDKDVLLKHLFKVIRSFAVVFRHYKTQQMLGMILCQVYLVKLFVFDEPYQLKSCLQNGTLYVFLHW